MTKIPFEVLQVEVEKLYAVEFPSGTSDKVIEDHCNLIAELIESSGWDITDYLNRWFNGPPENCN